MHAIQSFSLFFFNDTATTEIYTLSLHDALPISNRCSLARGFILPDPLFLIQYTPATRPAKGFGYALYLYSAAILGPLCLGNPVLYRSADHWRHSFPTTRFMKQLHPK